MKKISVIATVIAAIILVTIAGMVVANSQITVLTEAEVKALILEAMESQLSTLKSEYALDDLTLDFEVYEKTITKPTIFNEGYIHLDVGAFLFSSDFVELEEKKFDKDVIRRYVLLGDMLDFKKITIDNYFVNITTAHEDTKFLDGQKNEYYFSDFQDEYEVFRNGSRIYKYSEAPKDQCSYCGGTGSAIYNYGDSDLQAYLEGHDSYTVGSCPHCGGAGKN